jgi:hypothetical protein
MAYPTYATMPGLHTTPGTVRTLITDRQIERASNGSVRGRSFYTSPKSSFTIEHNTLTLAVLNRYMNEFYLYNPVAGNYVNITGSFTYVWPGDGQTYTCVLASDPVVTTQPGGFFNITVELLEV